MKDEPDEIQQDLCRQDLCAFGWVIGGGHFDEVDPDNIAPLAQTLQDFQEVVVLKAPMARTCRTDRMSDPLAFASSYPSFAVDETFRMPSWVMPET